MIIHTLANADYQLHQYDSVYIPGGLSVTLNGNAITTVSDVVLPVSVTPTSGTCSGNFFLLGKRKPEFYKNSNGTYPIN